MKVCVVGSGLFGSTAAIHAARAGHDVTLLERGSDILQGATATSFNRVHRGGHYPRDPATGRESRQAEASFRAEYGPAIIDSGRQFYVVPEEEENRTDAKAFKAFLEAEGLIYTQDGDIFQVIEPRLNVSALQALIRHKLSEAGVDIKVNTRARQGLRDDFDQIIVAAYAGLNEVMAELELPPTDYKYQLVERPLILLPQWFKDTSIVVLDGPFGCVDPLNDTPLHMLGHVTELVLASNVGTEADIPADLRPFVGKGLMRHPPVSRFREAVYALKRYIPGLQDAQQVGSSYVVRAVLAHVEDSDKRPTLVQRHDEQTLSIFSGKLGTACQAAQTAVAMLDNKLAVAA